MEKIGLIGRLTDAADDINAGRKGFATAGAEAAGRISYEDGISEAMTIFTEVGIGSDAELLIFAEITFLNQELHFCDSSDTVAIGSLTAAVASFDDALRALKTVGNATLYAGVETVFPRNVNYRVYKMPKDAFHIACIAHKMRLKNIQTAPGLNMTEKAIYKQRTANMGIAQGVYVELQKKVLEQSYI